MRREAWLFLAGAGVFGALAGILLGALADDALDQCAGAPACDAVSNVRAAAWGIWAAGTIFLSTAIGGLAIGRLRERALPPGRPPQQGFVRRTLARWVAARAVD